MVFFFLLNIFDSLTDAISVRWTNYQNTDDEYESIKMHPSATSYMNVCIQGTEHEYILINKWRTEIRCKHERKDDNRTMLNVN